MGSPPSAAEPITDDWVTHHFDHLSPRMAGQLNEAMARMRGVCPVAHSEEWGGFWVVSRYEDVLRVAQDWETFTLDRGHHRPVRARPGRCRPSPRCSIRPSTASSSA